MNVNKNNQSTVIIEDGIFINYGSSIKINEFVDTSYSINGYNNWGNMIANSK